MPVGVGEVGRGQGLSVAERVRSVTSRMAFFTLLSANKSPTLRTPKSNARQSPSTAGIDGVCDELALTVEFGK